MNMLFVVKKHDKMKKFVISNCVHLAGDSVVSEYYLIR